MPGCTCAATTARTPSSTPDSTSISAPSGCASSLGWKSAQNGAGTLVAERGSPHASAPPAPPCARRGRTRACSRWRREVDAGLLDDRQAVELGAHDDGRRTLADAHEQPGTDDVLGGAPSARSTIAAVPLSRWPSSGIACSRRRSSSAAGSSSSSRESSRSSAASAQWTERRDGTPPPARGRTTSESSSALEPEVRLEQARRQPRARERIGLERLERLAERARQRAFRAGAAVDRRDPPRRPAAARARSRMPSRPAHTSAPSAR